MEQGLQKQQCLVLLVLHDFPLDALVLSHSEGFAPSLLRRLRSFFTRRAPLEKGLRRLCLQRSCGAKHSLLRTASDEASAEREKLRARSRKNPLFILKIKQMEKSTHVFIHTRHVGSHSQQTCALAQETLEDTHPSKE